MKNGHGSRQGFALRELFFTICFLSCLAGLFIARAHKGQIDVKAVRCLSNLRQHGMALQLYAADYKNVVLAPEQTFTTPSRPQWLGRFYSMDYTSKEDNWNPASAFRASPVSPYTGTNLTIWRCPADPSRVRHPTGRFVPRVRTYSMSQTFGEGIWLPRERYQTYASIAQIPTPSKIWMVMDEHPDSINDAALAVEMAQPGATSARIIDFPGSQHQGGTGMLFSDGHVEHHTWRGAQLRPPVRGRFPTGAATTPDSINDLVWLSARTSIRR